MNGCQTCAVLRRQLHEARDEAESYRRLAGAEVANGAHAERVDRWARRMAEQPAAARVLIALVNAAPRPVTIDRLAEHVNPKRDVCDLESPENLIRTYVRRIRRALKGLYAGFPIRSVFQVGYAMDTADAAALCVLMGDGA